MMTMSAPTIKKSDCERIMEMEFDELAEDF